MSYQIQTKSDLSLGATLIVRIPETEVDKKALYTVEADPPKFALPFRHKNVDEYVELTYIIGTKNKLQYSFGSRNPQEYVALWSGVLTPLLDCDDWFMNPFSFVMQTDYMYYDKNSGIISYVYIPSLNECSDANGLKNMAVELAQKCPASTPDLEVKALRAIMQEFNPQQFLQLLKSYNQSADVPPVKAEAENYIPQQPVAQKPVASVTPVTTVKNAQVVNESVKPAQEPPVFVGSGAPDEIVIDLNGGKDKKKKPDKAKSGGFFGSKSDKPDKKAKPVQQAEPSKSKGGGLFGKKKADPQPIIMGAAAEAQDVSSYKTGIAPTQSGNYSTDGNNAGFDAADGVTQLDEDGLTQLESASAKLRLVSNNMLPPEIIVPCMPGKAFIIGRFDITVGRQQSDFEFDKSTKSVSRRHAAIEYSEQGYMIVDLSSSAGTFVNGQILTPNIPYPLTFGTRVSFGTSGADYVWEG